MALVNWQHLRVVGELLADWRGKTKLRLGEIGSGSRLAEIESGSLPFHSVFVVPAIDADQWTVS